MLWVGRISYSLYMTHFLLIMVMNKLLPVETISASSLPVRIAVFVGYFAFITIVAAGAYYLVEEPGRRVIRRRAARRVVAESPAL